jgi:outer membrane protein assembly factor BamA
MADGNQPPQQAFQLGGLRSDLNPYGVRGYETRFATGSNVATATIEYRFPAWYFLRGINTKPVFFDRLHGAFFTDAGEIWDKDRAFRSSDIKISAGTEIRMDMTLGYWLKLTPALGYARGLNRDGIDHLYFTIYMNL